MRLVRTTSLAGLALAALALPVGAFALSGSDGPGTPPATAHVSDPAEPDDTETEAPETEAPDTEAPDTEAPGQPGDTGTPNPASAAGRAHAQAMQAWAHCVAQAASGPKAAGAPRPPKLACGEKPLGPGRAKHLASGTAPAHPGGHGKGHHGR
ncbi:hypothetical protein [Nocardioides pocheonensis]|uniref:Protein tyrosine phosphatase n=1 Tax=Nocardioides pocheonensis TaxID=661485 RepID=A0A3N0GYD5_9ACTN|nr:hypothetical protein [Nocardioides pocheonensis]RNM17467.1 hypothetical protein EFL26_01385 [Nocardioides pocheonensis]